MGRDKEYPLSHDLELNLEILLNRMVRFEQEYFNFCGRTLTVSSGYRPGKYNRVAGGAQNSCHLTCRAVDLLDVNGAIKIFVLGSPKVLEICDLYMESPKNTPTWCHLDIRARYNRIFIP